MKTVLKIAIPATIALFVSACEVSNVGGVGPGPAPVQYREVVESKWLGTAPFCSAQPSDCSSLGSDWRHIDTNTTGDGSRCASGVKVLCEKRTRVPL